jgi:alcohol dehydrogenase
VLQLRLPIPRLISAGEILHGSGSLSALRLLDGVSVVVVASKSVIAFHREAIEKAINCLNLTIIEYSGGEPTFDTVSRLSGEINQMQPNWIVAIGGGAVLDAAKLGWVLYEQPDADFEVLKRPFSLKRLRGKCQFIAVPTTAGTGSEVSSAAVVSNPITGSKLAIVSHELIPDIAILDPRLTVSVPRAALVSAGMDALSHAIEGYVSKFINPIADIQAEKAIEMILRLLPRTVAEPENLELRLDVMVAAQMAGWVQNLKVPGIGHAVAHQIGKFGLPHGMACGGLLISAIDVNCRDSKASRKFEQLADRLGMKDVHELKRAIASLKEKLEVPERLSHMASEGKLTDDHKKNICVGAHLDICARSNPVAVTDDLILEMLELSW